MHRADITKKNIPEAPGVYFFLGARREILYIGRATTLSQRIKSYFDTNIREKRSPLIEKMVFEAKEIEWTITDSVLEAMLLEVNLIRTHKPRYNTISKDDKSYNHVVITSGEFPQVLVVRSKDLTEADAAEQYQSVFGPFPNGTLFREALKLLRKLFQYYDVSIQHESQKNKMLKGKIDFNRQIGLYPSECTKQEYARTIRHIRLFFEGKKAKIINALTREMNTAARRQEFEQAQILKKKIFALKHIQDVALITDESREYRDEKSIRIEAYDVAHLDGEDMVGVMVVFFGARPQKDAYRKFTITGCTGADDTRALKEILERRFAHDEWMQPDVVVVDGSTAQKNAALQILKRLKKSIPVLGVVKDEKHNPKRIIGSRSLIEKHKDAILHANAEAHRFAITFHRARRGKRFLPK